MAGRTVSLLTVGCQHDQADSDAIAAQLHDAGWRVVGLEANPSGSDVVIVNTAASLSWRVRIP